jgi:uncharacterized protein YcbK (DUF882 family)
MDLNNPFFTRAEFACKCGCGFDTVDAQLLEVLIDIRKYFAAPVTVNSGCRCADYNRKIGGAANSQHLLGRAADIAVKGASPRAIANFIENAHPTTMGVGRYRTFTHVDSRTVKARWGANG